MFGRMLMRSAIQLGLIVTIGFAPSSESFVAPETGKSVRQKPTHRQAASQEIASIGFIGCGTIASAIVTGICSTSTSTAKIRVSRRTESKSSLLQVTFPDQVTVHDDNQEIVDQSDVVFLCVLPQRAAGILQSLTFDPSKHRLVSLVSTASLTDLANYSKLPLQAVSRMICIPAVARGEGLCLQCGSQKDQVLASLFAGGTIFTTSETQLNVMMVTACLMGPLYGIMQQNQDWLVRHGVSETDAAKLVTSQYMSMVRDSTIRPGVTLEDLIQEQTPGGLNKQALENVQQLGVLEAFDKSMCAILARIEGTSDGSI